VSNLAQRVLVGVVAIPIILVLCMAGGPYFFGFIALVSAVTLREFYGLAEAKGARPLMVAGIVAGFAINLSFYVSWPAQPVLLVVTLVAAVVLFSLWELFRNDGSPLLNLSATFFGLLYVSLLFGTLIGLRELFDPGAIPLGRILMWGAMPPASTGAATDTGAQMHRWGGYLVISVLVMIWICDSAAFHVGAPLGKHKLFPRVSPNKSWEGAIAGFVFAIIAAIAAKYLVLAFLPLASAIVIGAIVGTAGQLGDLVESLFKRDAGVKDSSALIPGHGGALDRFDSILLVSPCVYLYLHFALFQT
jgi:phosphatidate cytidylyltransferase